MSTFCGQVFWPSHRFLQRRVCTFQQRLYDFDATFPTWWAEISSNGWDRLNPAQDSTLTSSILIQTRGGTSPIFFEPGWAWACPNFPRVIFTYRSSSLLWAFLKIRLVEPQFWSFSATSLKFGPGLRARALFQTELENQSSVLKLNLCRLKSKFKWPGPEAWVQ